MCTVTFIPVRDVIFLTSNRDEKNNRSDAQPPAVHQFHSGRMLFPKDADAGGTWIAGHENGNAVVFLNGGLESHVPQPPYRKSRGLILLDLIDHSTPFNCFLAINLNNIEPFTAIIMDNGHLFECRWDGSRKTYSELDTTSPHIWSSVTLYNNDIRSRRKQWFEEWIAKNPAPTQEEILAFHQFTGDGDVNNDLMMNRDGKVFTVSITSLMIETSSMNMDYLDVKNGESYSVQMMYESSISGNE
jgi:hypothetical protein